MKVRHFSSAVEEIARAAEYFESQDMGLGLRFLDTIDQAINEISETPLAWPVTRYDTRKRILITPFPLYDILQDRL